MRSSDLKKLPEDSAVLGVLQRSSSAVSNSLRRDRAVAVEWDRGSVEGRSGDRGGRSGDRLEEEFGGGFWVVAWRRII